MKRLILLLLSLILLLPCFAGLGESASDKAPADSSCPVITTEVDYINKYGNVVLSISDEALKSQGYEALDMINVSIAGKELVMPIVTAFADVEIHDYVCCIQYNSDKARNEVLLSVSMSSMADDCGLARKTAVEEDPGYRWDYLVPTPIEVTISMKEKQGYAATYKLLHLTRTNDRKDYPNLTDEQYANFRNIKTTGMGSLILYRSSSPVNPELNRNREADEALNNAGIRTVLNLADNDSTMRGYEGYASSYYSQRNVIALNLDLTFVSDSFKANLAQGINFLVAHDGPYLVHCTEGKDRAGFVSALFECLMGATLDEVYADYMVTYYNYYGVEPGTEQYSKILHGYLEKILKFAFEVEDLMQADLVKEAEEYLKSTGLSEETIEALKSCLSRSGAD